MPFSTPYPSCIFCGARANSREHAIPAWMSRRLGIKEQMITRSGNLPRRKQPISFASHRARIFCKPCNTHFKALEDTAIPLLVPMAKGRVLSLDNDSQTLLALWAAKTAIALVAATPDLREFVPQAHRDAVRYDGRPAAESWVGYVPWEGRSAQVFVGDNTLTGPPEHPAAGYQSWGVVFAFKRAAFMVVGFIDPIPANCKIDVGPFPVLQFWPPRPGLIHWPIEPAREADFAKLIAFAPLFPI